MTRLFFALRVPPNGILERIYRRLKGEQGKLLKCVEPEKQHFTLKFLGDSGVDTGTLITAARSAVEGYRPFPVRLMEAGAFPSWKRPSVIWIGPGEDGPLSDLSRELDEVLHNSIGSRLEKRGYSPHLTIARVRRDKTVPSARIGQVIEDELARAGPSDVEFQVDRVELISSILSPDGPHYTTVEKIYLDQSTNDRR